MTVLTIQQQKNKNRKLRSHPLTQHSQRHVDDRRHGALEDEVQADRQQYREDQRIEDDAGEDAPHDRIKAEPPATLGRGWWAGGGGGWRHCWRVAMPLYLHQHEADGVEQHELHGCHEVDIVRKFREQR